MPDWTMPDWEAVWARRRDAVPRPRVSWCALTRKWVLTLDGRRHECSRAWKLDEAFRYQHDAMTEGARAYTARVQAAWEQFERVYLGPGRDIRW